MSESDVHAAVDVSDSVRVGKGDCRKYGFMGLSGNAGRSRHGVGSKEGAASARRVEQAALSRRNTGLKGCAPSGVLLYCSGKSGVHITRHSEFQPAGAQATGRCSCTRLTKKIEVSPNKYWTKGGVPHTLFKRLFLCFTPPFPLRAARPWQWSIR